MADTSDFRNGLVLVWKGDLWQIVEFLHVKPGKGGAFVRTKLKNVRTGQVVDNTFRAGSASRRPASSAGRTSSCTRTSWGCTS